MNTGILAYARTLDVWGKSGKFDVILPYSELSGNAMVGGQPRERNVSGLNDPRFRFSVNFYGAPALSLQEFADYQQDLIIGASVQTSAPIGQYDQDKLVNLGNNRWFVKPDIGISKAWGALSWSFPPGFFSSVKMTTTLAVRRLNRTPSVPCRRMSRTTLAMACGLH